LPLET